MSELLKISLDMKRWATGVHAAIVAFAGTAISLGFLGLLFVYAELYDWRYAQIRTWVVLAVLSLLWLWLDGSYLFHTWKRRMHCSDDPVGVAHALPRLPILLRPLLFLWWIAHFGMAALAAYLWHFAIMKGSTGTAASNIYLWTVAVISAIILCSTANTFLAAAVASLTRKRDITERLWSARHFIDCAVAVAVCVVPYKFQ